MNPCNKAHEQTYRGVGNRQPSNSAVSNAASWSSRMIDGKAGPCENDTFSHGDVGRLKAPRSTSYCTGTAKHVQLLLRRLCFADFTAKREQLGLPWSPGPSLEWLPGPSTWLVVGRRKALHRACRRQDDSGVLAKAVLKLSMAEGALSAWITALTCNSLVLIICTLMPPAASC